MRLYYNPKSHGVYNPSYTIMSDNTRSMYNVDLENLDIDINNFERWKYPREYPLEDFQFICSFEDVTPIYKALPHLFI